MNVMTRPSPIKATVSASVDFLDTSCDYLVLSSRDLYNVRNLSQIDRDESYVHLLSPCDEANEMLNTVSLWMKNANMLDQRRQYGDDFEKFNVSLYRVSDAPTCYPSLVGEYLLKDYIFPDRQMSDAGSFDDFMKMLDRDRLAEDMRKTLVHEFNMPLRADAPLFWRRDLRQVSHPDWRRFQSADQMALSA